MITKFCLSCSTEKSVDSFGNDSRTKDLLRTYCKSCNTKKATEYQISNKEKRNAYLREWSKKNPDKVRRSHIKARFNLEWEAYLALYASQNGGCSICGTPIELYNKKGGFEKKAVAVDHDHRTGKVRGLLCSQCNKGLGHFRDSIEIVEKALLYLKEHK